MIFCKDLFNTLAQTSNIKNFGNTNIMKKQRLSIVLLKETAKTVKFPVDQGDSFSLRVGKFEAVKLNIAEVFGEFRRVINHIKISNWICQILY